MEHARLWHNIGDIAGIRMGRCYAAAFANGRKARDYYLLDTLRAAFEC